MTSISSAAPATAAGTSKFGAAFFEHLWRGAGVQAVVLAIAGLVLYTFLPFVAAPIFGLAILNLTWFMAAVRTTLADHGLDGWGAAGTAASAAFAGLAFALIAIALTVPSLAGSGTEGLASGLASLGWSAWVLSSFPRAMFVMAGSFGFWRAGLITREQFRLAVGLVILGVLGGTTWFAVGPWAPDGLFSLIILPALELVWVVAAGRVLGRAPSTRTGF